MVIVLAIIGAITYLVVRLEPQSDKCTSVLYLQGKPISAELALKSVTLKGSVSPAAQEVIGKDLQDYAQRTHTFCMMHDAGVISNSEYKDEIVQINNRTMAIVEASSKGSLSNTEFNINNLDAIVFGTLKGDALPGPFLLFFDWERSNITPEAAAILSRIGEQCHVLRDQGVSFVVSFVAFGGGDGSPAETLNDQTVSMAELPINRLISLMRYLRKPGPSSCRSPGVVSLGHETPPLETADGVRQPQMRRIEVSFMRQV